MNTAKKIPPSDADAYEQVLAYLLETLAAAKRRWLAVVTIALIHEETSLPRPQIKRVLDQLVAQGLVKQSHNPGGGISRELYRAMSQTEYALVVARRGIEASFVAVLGPSDPDDLHRLVACSAEIRKLLDMTDEQRAAFEAALDKFDAAYEQEIASESDDFKPSPKV